MNTNEEIPKVKVRPENDAAIINAVLNDPAVRPWVADASAGEINIHQQLEDPNVVFLMGEYGGVMLHRFMSGIVEVHTFVEPRGRGAWTRGMIQAVQHWIFTKTDCFEILTRIPISHKPALALAIKSGMVHEFTRPDGVTINGVTMPVDIYKLTIADWVKNTPSLERRGEVFHTWLNEEAAKVGYTNPHEDDPQHNRIVGATLEMIMGGQPLKGVLFYNRWAVISRHAPIALTSLDPVTVKFDIGTIHLRDGTLEFTPCGRMMLN